MINKPLNYMGYNVTTIEDPELGSFHYDSRHNFFEWSSSDGLDYLSIPMDLMLKIIRKQKEIFAILGVDIDDSAE